MKYSILGFNQETVVNYKVPDDTGNVLTCDLSDLLILNYVIYALANPKMKHYVDKECNSYVWLNHTHLLEDLPILNITAGTLKNRLTKLRKMDLLASITISNESSQGSKTYYRTTSLLNDAIFETTSQNNDALAGPRHLNVTPDNKQNNKKVVISKDINNFEFGKPKEHKQTLYGKCINHINAFSTSPVIRQLLTDFLDSLCEMKKLRGEKQFAGILNKLKLITLVTKEQEEIIKYSIEHGYGTFYDCRESKRSYGYGSKPKNVAVDIEQLDPSAMTHATQEQKQKFKEDIANGKAKKY